MTVEPSRSFVQPPGERNPDPVTVSANLVATLRGTQAESAGRVYVISGHYDSRCTDVLDFTCDAPGADDDASGVATVLELARVMAKRRFDATIVFMAVAGEEQGLYGSTYFAPQAKAQGMDVEGMFTNDIVGSSTSDKGRRDPFTVRLFSEGVPTTETPQQAALRQSSAARTTGPRASSRASSRRSARTRPPTCTSGSSGAATATCAAATRSRSCSRDIRRCGSPSPRELRPPAPGRPGGERRAVRRPAAVRRLRLHRRGRASTPRRWPPGWAPPAPKDAKIDTTQLTNDTTLTWNADPEPDLAGYEIVWRESTDGSGRM